MRLFIVDRWQEPLGPRDIVEFGHVGFPDEAVEASHLQALQGLIDRMKGEPCYFYAGGSLARDKAPELFAMLGGTALMGADGLPLAPFHCARHGFDLQLLAFDSTRPAAMMESGLELMVLRLQTMTAWTPAPGMHP
jgi:hypothetical protein